MFAPRNSSPVAMYSREDVAAYEVNNKTQFFHRNTRGDLKKYDLRINFSDSEIFSIVRFKK